MACGSRKFTESPILARKFFVAFATSSAVIMLKDQKSGLLAK